MPPLHLPSRKFHPGDCTSVNQASFTNEGAKGFFCDPRTGHIFSVKREIKNLIHVNCDQGHFRDSVDWYLFFREK